MLPRSIYEALPYLYIAAGLLCRVFIDSDIVYIPSALLVLAGLIVIWMRRKATMKFKFSKPGKRPRIKGVPLSVTDSGYQLRERVRRLPEEDLEFPITDDNGNMVAFNRRQGERRKNED